MFVVAEGVGRFVIDVDSIYVVTQKVSCFVHFLCCPGLLTFAVHNGCYALWILHRKGGHVCKIMDGD